MSIMTEPASLKQNLAATLVSDNQVSDEEKHVSFISAAANRWKGCAYFKPAQNPQVKDARSPKTDPTDRKGSFFTLRTFHASSVNQWLLGKRVQGDAGDKVNDGIIGLDLF